MANRPNNIWAKAAAGSPGTNIARAQQSRWTGVPNEAIMRLVEDKIGSMLEGTAALGAGVLSTPWWKTLLRPFLRGAVPLLSPAHAGGVES